MSFLPLAFNCSGQDCIDTSWHILRQRPCYKRLLALLSFALWWASNWLQYSYHLCSKVTPLALIYCSLRYRGRLNWWSRSLYCFDRLDSTVLCTVVALQVLRIYLAPDIAFGFMMLCTTRETCCDWAVALWSSENLRPKLSSGPAFKIPLLCGLLFFCLGG